MVRTRPGAVFAALATLLVSLAGLGGPARAAGPAERQQEYAGYLFAYFTGEDTADGEQVHLALSEGNDPLRWREVNGGAPVLTSTLGERGVRDPFLIRSPEGDRFYLLATDLRIHGNGDWDRAVRHGSRSIMVWESTDLVNWSEQRSVEVSPPTAGNTWAPEAYWDASRGVFVVFWASALYAEDDPDHTGDSHQRMLYATTEDFRTFSEPAVWHDPGHAVIDSTVIEHEGVYHRFTKDERSASPDHPCGKFVTQERATDLLDPAWELVADCLGRGTEAEPGLERGEGPTVFRSNTEERWYLFIDEFGGRGYVPFETTDPASGEWTMSPAYDLPASPRHGTVVPVTEAEYARLAERWGGAAGA
ncbi:family 43 glycosylhydrolase [Streptomyces sp. 3MP-14]|uniref:Family 43 glycosylhydrolase n=1 Tax=Streptomyces mimosae TaxID=2586635 RepID=A0A5N6A0C3_9ACTN|nr:MULTISPECIES: glycoside hydrolase family 43 protein [Streptomyces]KAB8161286.1 family 43 glycosylhydrolase [Streptomyces mimosae]KAB8173088.1 family 43 glycosylhydrolase [Streptomyces sp. 3MP-14]